MRSPPVALDLVLAIGRRSEVPERQRPLPLYLHRKAVLDIEVRRRHRIGRRHEDETGGTPDVTGEPVDERRDAFHAFVHERPVGLVLLDVEQRQPRCAVLEIPDEIPGLG